MVHNSQMRVRISLPTASITTAPFLTVYVRSWDDVRVAQGVLGDDLGVLSNDEMGGRARSGEWESVPPPPQQPPPPPPEDLCRRLDRHDELLSGVPCTGVV